MLMKQMVSNHLVATRPNVCKITFYSLLNNNNNNNGYFTCYFSGEHIALSINKNNNGVNIALGKTNRLKALCMMQINT